uniref:Fibronectin type-III domain-containing protein n=1 Tax=viral metagenome TaxID=1070528 RepID=A0A6C0IC79_9ZZZZ
MASPALNYVYDGPVYVIQASGGFQTQQSFDTVHRLTEAVIFQYDVTNSVEVLFDVRTFNTLIGISKDLDNINVTSDHFYDISTNSLHVDSISLSASQFVTGLGNNTSNVISVGCLDTLYHDFTNYVEQYFGFKGQIGTNNIYGTASLYSGLNDFYPNHGVFDASAFLNIITSSPNNGQGAYINDLSGQITINNITQLLRYAVDTNIFGNRDPSNGVTASDPYNHANYGVTDGFFADDLIFIPSQGIQITLNLAIQSGSFTSTTMITTGQYADIQDTSFNALTNSSGTFIETSNFSNTGIGRTVSAPLLIRLANLTNAQNSGFTVKTTAIGPYLVSFELLGQYTSVNVTRNGTLLAEKVTGPVFTDNNSKYPLSPASNYSYIFQSFIGSSAGIAYTTSITTAIPPAPAPTVTVANIASFTTRTRTASSIYFDFSGNFASYTMYRGSTLIYGGTYSDVSYVDTGLSANSAYVYTIIPYTSSSSAGTSINITTYTLSNITGITSTYIDISSIYLNIAGSYSSYKLYRNDKLPIVLFSGASTSYNDTSLNPNTTYTYTISSYNVITDLTTYPSTSWSFTTLPVLSSLSVGIQTATSIKLLFTGSYQYVTITRSDGVTFVNQPNDVSFLNTDLTPNTTYSYTVVPYNVTGNGSSRTISTCTLGGVTANSFTVSAYTSQNITLSFSGTYSFLKLYRNGSLLPGADDISNTNTYNDSTVVPNTTYTYTLYPYNILGQYGVTQTVIQTTLSTLTSFYVGTQTATTTKLLFAGSYKYVKLIRTDGGLNRNIYNDISYTDTNSPDQTYTYTATPYDIYGNVNNSATLSINIYTLPLLTGSLSLGSVTGSSVQIGFAGSYNYVDICRNGILIAHNVYGTNYTDTNSVLGNTNYVYTVTPYNLSSPINTPGSQATIATTTLPIINPPITYIPSLTSIKLFYNGQYDYVDICRNGLSFTGIKDVSFVETNLMDDYLYNYTIVPKSNSGNIGTSQQISVYTLPKLISFTNGTITTNSIVLNFTGNYQYVKLYRNNVLIANNINGNTYLDTSLNSNTTYNYTTTPYNPYDISGSSLSLNGLFTYPQITSFVTKNIQTNSIGLNFLGFFDYVSLIRSDGGMNIYSLRDTSYTDTYGILSNHLYSYTVTPYHSDGTNGNSLNLSIYSLPYLQSFYVDSASTASDSIQLDYSGNYDSVDILRTSDNVFIAQKYTNSFFLDTSVNRNTNYAYQITPYNPAPYLLSGSKLSLQTFSYPKIDTSVNELVDTTSIQLFYKGAYDYISITRDGTTLVTNWTDVSYADTGLTSNTPYQYTLTPYHIDVCNGNIGIAGVPLVLPSIYTLATIYTNPPVISNNSVLLDVSGTYSNISITRNQTGGRNIIEVAYLGQSTDLLPYTYKIVDTKIVYWDDMTMDCTLDPYHMLDPSGVVQESVISVILQIAENRALNYRNDSFVDYGLNSNALYTYSIIPYNRAGYPSNPFTFTVNTLPLLIDLYATPNGNDITSTYIMYDGSYDHVKIYRDNTLVGSDISAGSFLDTGLVANFYPYNYTVIPYNMSNNEWSSLSISISTLPLLDAGSFVTSQITSTSITLSYSGRYSTVSVYNTSVSVDLSSVILLSTGNSCINRNLSPNTSYNYLICPYNSMNQLGITASLSTTTAPLLTQLSIGTKDISSIQLLFDGSYSYVNIYSNGNLVSNVNTSKTFKHTGLTANTNYQYAIIPYNTYNRAGDNLYISAYTLPLLRPYLYSYNIQSNISTVASNGSMISLLQLNYDGSYGYVDISRNGAGIITNYTSNLYVDSYLTPNTTYSYVITPFSSNDEIGVSLQFAVTTAPIITSVISGSKTNSSSIQLVISGNYAWFDLSRNGITRDVNVNTTSYRDTNNIIANNIYIYVLTPYNSAGISGTPYTFTGYSYPMMNTGSYVNNQKINSLVVNFTGLYNYVKIQRYNGIGTLLFTNPISTGTQFLDTNLTANTTYTYILTPYNQTFPAQDGSSVILSGTTLPLLYTVGGGIKTSTTAQILFTGAYDHVLLHCTSDITVSDATSYDISYTFTGLAPNTSYTFSLTPYDIYNNAGSSLSITIYNLPLLSSNHVTIGITTIHSIQLLFSDVFSYVHIFRNGTDINGGNPIRDTSFVDTGLSEYTNYTYQIVPYNNNNDPGTSVSITATTVLALPYISTVNTGIEDISSIQLIYTGVFVYVNIYRNGTLIANNITTSTYTDTSLNTDTKYTYFITPYGNVTMGVSQSITAYTLPLINANSLSISNISSSSLTLSYSGIFDSVNIYRGSTLIVTGNTGNLYVDTGILNYPNTLFTYTIVPENVGNAGSSASISITTPAKLNSLTPGTIGYQSIQMLFTGIYQYVTITRDDGTITTLASHLIDTSFTDTGLLGDTQYVYTVTPYNSAVVPTAGSSLIMTAYTLPSLTIGSITATNIFATSMIIHFTGYYSFVNLYRNDSILVKAGITGTYYQDSNLTANTQYSYTVYPYNSNHPPTMGTSATITNITTSASLTNVSFGTKTTNSVQLILDTNPAYYYVKIFRNGFYLGQTYGSSFTDYNINNVPTLAPNTAYQYVAIPYNMVDISSSIVTKTTYTASQITSATISIINTNSITLSYTGNYTNVSIYRSDMNSIPLTFNYSGNSYVDVSCQADTAYSYSIVPYNLLGEAGNTYSLSATTTLPYLSKLTPGIETLSSIQIKFTGLYQYVRVSRNSVLLNGGNKIYDISYTDSTVNDYEVPYLYTVIPYNNQDVAGSSLSITMYSLPLLNSGTISASNITTNSAHINFDGSYAYVQIYRNGTFVLTASSSPYRDIGNLSINTTYIYTIVPYNQSDLSGSSATISVLTLPNLSNTSVINDTSMTENSLTLRFLPPYTNYAYLTITSNVSTIPVNIMNTSTSYTNSGLSPNTFYNYTITPYNNTGKNTAINISNYTLPIITNHSFVTGSITTNSTSLVIGGSYSYITILRTDTNNTSYYLLNGSTTNFSSNGTIINDITNISPNTIYTYAITPYNPLNIAGTNKTLVTKTLPRMNSVSTGTLSTSNVELLLLGNYDYVNISRTYTSNNITYNSTIINNFTGTSYLDSIGLNILYTYTIIPFSYGINGTNDISGTSVQRNVYALPMLSTNPSNINITSITSTSLTLNYRNGAFSYVLITRNGVSIPNIQSNGQQSSYTDSNVSPNTSYTYVITPYNPLNIAGTPYTLSANTLPLITTVATGRTTTDSVQIKLDSSNNTFVNFDISRNGTILQSHIYDTCYVDTGLSPNTSYSYTITPYNTTNNSGNSYVYSTFTLPSIGTISITNSTAGNTVFTVNSSNYNRIDISRNDVGIITSWYIGTTYTDYTTIANTQYTYLFKPYNQLNVMGSPLLVTYNALPTLTSLTAGAQIDTSNSIQLLFSGLYNYVKIRRNGTVIVAKLSDISYTDTNLTPDTSYTYTVTPQSTMVAGDISGMYLTASAYTQPLLYNFGASYVGTTSLILTMSGLFYKANILRTTGTVQKLYTDVSGSTFTDIVNPNTLYSYQITPYSPNSLPGSYSIYSTTTSSSLSILSGTVTTSSITLLFSGAYLYLSGTIGGISAFTNLNDISYTFTGLSGYNTSYNMIVNSYNSVGVLGTSVNYSAYTLANITSVTIGTYSAFSAIINYTGNYSSVGIVRNGQTIALVNGSGITTYTDASAVPNTTYTYGVIPYNGNLPPLPGTQVNASATITTPSGLNPTIGALTTNSIQVLFGGNFSYMYLNINTVFAFLAKTTDISYIAQYLPLTTTPLSPNTPYTFTLTPYNASNVAGSAVSSTIYTLPIFTSFITNVISSSTVQLLFGGSYSYYKITRNGSTIYANTNMAYDISYVDSGLTLNSTYIYTITPYNYQNYPGTTLTTTTVITNSVFIYNGAFNLTPATYGWTVTTGTGCAYYVGNGTNYYTGTLPSITTQYFVGANSTTSSGQKIILSQAISFVGITKPTTYLLSFCAFPASVINALHTLTVYMNGITLLNNMSFGSTPNTPYSTFNLPFIISTNGTYTLNFVFYSPNNLASTIGVTAVQIFNSNIPGIGAFALDAAGLNMYYPFDLSAGIVADTNYLNNYASGLPIVDASLNGGATLTQINPAIGTACLSLNSSNQQYVSINPSINLTTSGFSICGWFYPSGTQSNLATIFSLTNPISGGVISLGYRTFYGQTRYLDFYINGTFEFIATNYSIKPGFWYFYAMSASYNVSSGKATYNFYLNNTLIHTYTNSVWPSVTSYTMNTLGYATGTAYFNGFMDDFRFYNRVLSTQDVATLWNYTVATTNNMFSLVDSYKLNMYYPFDLLNQSATYLPILVVANGGFDYPILATNSYINNPVVVGWSITSGTKYTLYNGTSNYAYGLPAGISQYMGIQSGTSLGKSTYTMSQTMTLSAGTGIPTQYILSFVAFPLDNSYNSAHTFSVNFGNTSLLLNQSFANSSSTVPYNSYNLPFQVNNSGTFTLSFVFSNTGSMTSTIGITKVQVSSNTIIGSGYNAIDTTNLSIYYPLSILAGSTSGTSVYNFYNGTGVLDAVLNNGATMVTSNPAPYMGSACLSLSSTSSQSMTINSSFTIAPTATVGSGFSIGGWFYASGVQNTKATIFCLAGTSGQISLSYKSYLGNNQYLDFLVTGCVEYIAGSYPITANNWYFFTMVASCQSTSGNTNTTYQFYLNNILLSTKYGPWPTVTSYTNNTLGYGAGGYFNGAIQDMRFYTRILSTQDINALWNYGIVQRNNYFGLIDTAGINMYYSLDSTTTLNYKVLSIIDLATTNGMFTIPTLAQNSTSSLNPSTLINWLFSTNAQYYLYNGNSVYAYGLPSTVSQYIGIVGISSLYAITMYQTISVTVTTSTQFILSFHAFPADNNYNTKQTLTVTIGGVTLLSNYSFIASSSTVPYNTFNIPFSISQTGNYPLVFSFANTTNDTSGSILCVTGVSVANILAGSAYNTIDPSGLALYYPFNSGSIIGSVLNDYTTGVAIPDATITNNAIITTTNPTPIYGSGSLSLSSNANQSATLNSFILPTVPVSSAGGSVGFSVSCWFDPSGAQPYNACIFSLRNSANLGISTFYNETNSWLDISINGVTYDIIPNMNPITPGTWNLLVLVGSCLGGFASSGASYTLYLNNRVIQTFVGAWPSTVSSYTTNTLGYGGNGTGYFNGNIDDFRTYTRALSSQDVATLWNSVEIGNSFGNIIDPVNLQIYYPFNQGTNINYYGQLVSTNGKFSSQILTTNSTSSSNPTIYGWTFSNNSSYYLYNGTSVYGYGLPTGISQYVGMRMVPGGGTTTFSQSIPATAFSKSDNSYLVMFQAFPMDASYNSSHTLTVSLGNVILLNNVSFTVSNTTVPYISYVLPLTIAYTGSYTLNFRFTNPDGISASTICITNIQVILANTPAVGSQVVDPTGLQVYYPFDLSAGIVGANLYDYATGVGVADAIANFGASIGTNYTPLAGTGYLSLASANNQSVTMTKTISIGASPTTGAGFSITGWFNTYSIMPNFNACIFSWIGSGGNNISAFLQRNNNYLDFSCNGVQEIICNDTIFPNTWNYFAMVAKYNGAGSTGTTYTYYFNNQSVSVNGAWPLSTTYTSLQLGQNTAAGLGYFNGGIDDFRIYTRPLSKQDITSVWNYGMAYQKKYGNLVDPTALQIYYPFSQGAEISYYDSFNTLVVSNGLFISKSPTGTNPPISGWTTTVGTGASYILSEKGTSNYTYGLPTSVTQYLVVSAGNAGTSTTISQNILFVLTNVNFTNYILSFKVFPIDNGYNPVQTLSVSIGNIVLLNKVVFVSSTTSVPYTTFNIPITLNYSGTFPLAFTFSNSTTVVSSLCIADVSMIPSGSASPYGAGYNTVDISNMAMYYSFDANSYGGTLIHDYATGTAVIDASMSSIGMIGPAIGGKQIGTACISFNAISNQSATLASFTVPPQTTGNGLSFTTWFYPSGTQTTNATLFSFQNTTGGSISCFYNGANNWLDISANPGTEYVAWSYRIVPNTWNFFAYIIQYNGSTTTHSYYLNDVSMSKTVGMWPDVSSSYTKNWLGYGSNLGYFNGYMDDFRMYKRAISSQEIFSLWQYGNSFINTNYGNIIDPTAIQVYYPFSQSTICPVFTSVSVAFSAYSGLSTGSGTLTVNYSSPVSFFNVSVARNTSGVIGSGNQIIQPRGATSMIDTNLRADTSYNYSITPYSEYGVKGSTITTTTISPTADVSFTNYSAINTTGLTLNFDTSVPYYYTSIARITNDVCGSFITQPVGQYVFTDISLSANTKYAYSVTSYNILNISGGTINRTATVYTLPVVTNITGVATSNQLTITVIGSYSYFTWLNTNTGTTATVAPGVTSFVDTSNISNTNIGYIYTITPYNVSNAVGTPITSSQIYSLPNVTITQSAITTIPYNATVVNTSNTNVIVNSVVGNSYSLAYNVVDNTKLLMYYYFDPSYSVEKITVNVVGGYYYFKWKNNVTGISNTMAPGVNSFVDTYRIAYNTAYTYNITPYNQSNVAGSSYTTATLNTLPLIYNTTVVQTISSEYVNLVINGSYYYFTWKNNQTGMTATTTPGVTSFTDTSISYGMSYNYTITPYNIVDASGDLVTTPVVYAFPNITSSSSVVTAGTITTNVVGAYNYFTWKNNQTGMTATTSPGVTSFTDTTNIAYNTAYTYTFTPYNTVNTAGYTYTTPTVYSLPIITATVPSAIRTANYDQMSVSVTGSYNYFTWINNQTGLGATTLPGVTSFVDSSSIAYNVSYTYRITPYNVVNVSGGLVTTTALYSLPNVASSSSVVTAGQINTSVVGAYSYFAWTNNQTGITATMAPGITSFTDTSNIAYNTAYTYNIVPYNPNNTYGYTYTTPTVYSLPIITATVPSAIRTANYDQMSVSVTGSYSYFTWINNQTGLGATTLPGVTSFVDSSSIDYNVSYTYRITPYNVVNVSGGLVTTTALYSLPNVTSSSSVVTAGNIATSVVGVYSYFAWTNNQTGITATMAPGVTSFTDTSNIAYNTTYTYNIVPYNPNNTYGYTYTTPTLYSLPIVTGFSVIPSTVQLTISVIGSYSYITWKNNVTGTTVTLAPGVTSFVDNTAITSGASYTYTITPYNVVNVSGGTVTSPSYVAANQILNNVSNGGFSVPLLSTGAKSFNPSISGWNFRSGTNYYLYNGSGVGTAYTSPLPSASTQYLGMYSGTTIGTVSVAYQTMFLSTTTMDTKFLLSFAVFPLDGSYNAGQTMSVSIGNIVLFQNYSLPVSSTTVPYITMNYPFSIGNTGNYTLTFTINNNTTSPSTIGITNVIVQNYNNSPGIGYNAIDPSGMAMYYAFDPSAGIVGSTLYDYATGSQFADGVVYNNAIVQTAIPMVGKSSLYISSASSQYVSLGSVTMPSGVLNAGFTIAGWFYILGTQATNAVVFCLNSGSSIANGNNLIMYYNTLLGAWEFLITGCSPYIMNNVNMKANTWNFFAVTIQYQGSGNTGTLYNYYLNGSLVNTISSTWPSGVSYTNNTIGYANGLGYFNGYIDDFRVYTRTLTANDVLSLWDYGVLCTPKLTPGIIDSTAMIMYYNFDMTTITPIAMNPPVTLYNGVFTSPIVSTNTASIANVAVANWLFSSGAQYNVYNGTAVYANATSLPYTVTQYVGIVSNTMGAGSYTMSQNLVFTIGSATSTSTTYQLSFYAFPRDNSYNTNHTMSVSIGNVTLVSGVVFTVSATSVPYTPFNIPMVIPVSGTYKLTFTFQNTSAITSTICITNVAITNTATVASAYNLVNPTSQAMYYPFDTNTVSGTGIYNYASGYNTLFPDASLNAGAQISTTNPFIGTGSVSLLSASSQYVTVAPLTVPVATTGAGVTFSGWFNASGTQPPFATLFNMSGSGGKISLFYNGNNSWLDFSANGGVEYIASSNPVLMNNWNYFAYTILYNGTNATHSYYLNNKLLTTLTGAYPSTVSYTNNTLGYGAGLGYFNGFMDDFRVYTRVLSVQEIGGLWNFGVSPSMSYSLIDVSGMNMYYSMDNGTRV